MRKHFEQQLSIDILPIQNVKLPLKSRDELPPVLLALQHIYKTPDLNKRIYAILEEKILKGKKHTGRLGMSLWEILVLGTVRQCLEADYDRLENHANYDKLVRRILGVEQINGEGKQYGFQTIKDNISLLDDKTLDRINEIVLEAGYCFKKNEEPLRLKADTYVLETNVHFPTDINLLWDSARKCLDTMKYMVKEYNINGWRKLKFWHRQVKNNYRKASKDCFAPGRKNPQKQQLSVKAYLQLTNELDAKINLTTENILQTGICDEKMMFLMIEMEQYQKYLRLFTSQIERRVIKGEEIAASEKIFSVFEPHTEWIKKGKAGNKVELGHRHLVVTDQNNFVVFHKVLINQTDSQVVEEINQTLKNGIAGKKVWSISYDKGFYSLSNKQESKQHIPMVVMPKRGKLNKEELEEESGKSFKKLRNKHSAVESNINQLEHNGLNRCPDKGLKNFKRYAALGVLAYNLHHLGMMLLEKEREEHKKLRNCA